MLSMDLTNKINKKLKTNKNKLLQQQQRYKPYRPMRFLKKMQSNSHRFQLNSQPKNHNQNKHSQLNNHNQLNKMFNKHKHNRQKVQIVLNQFKKQKLKKILLLQIKRELYQKNKL